MEVDNVLGGSGAEEGADEVGGGGVAERAGETEDGRGGIDAGKRAGAELAASGCDATAARPSSPRISSVIPS